MLFSRLHSGCYTPGNMCASGQFWGIVEILWPQKILRVENPCLAGLPEIWTVAHMEKATEIASSELSGQAGDSPDLPM